jgi:hypothetical protein
MDFAAVRPIRLALSSAATDLKAIARYPSSLTSYWRFPPSGNHSTRSRSMGSIKRALVRDATMIPKSVWARRGTPAVSALHRFARLAAQCLNWLLQALPQASGTNRQTSISPSGGNMLAARYSLAPHYTRRYADSRAYS